MITKEDVQHIAKLARLGLTEKEIEKFQRELSLILDYIEKLKEVDISGVKAELQPLELEITARDDEERQRDKIERVKKLLKLAPENENSFLKVKSIF